MIVAVDSRCFRTDPLIREATISHLDTEFDRHLAQAECVRSLFIALNDEVYVIRELAIKVIGRLAHLNPAYVMPSLRKTLIQLLTELEYSTARYAPPVFDPHSSSR